MLQYAVELRGQGFLWVADLSQPDTLTHIAGIPINILPVIMAITSQVRQPLGFGEAMVTDWQTAGLIKSSLLKPVFTTIEQGLVLRSMGVLSEADLRALREVVYQVR